GCSSSRFASSSTAWTCTISRTCGRTSSMEILVLLAVPALGALLLAFFGARAWAPEANVFVSLATFAAACALTARVIDEGTLTAAGAQFFIDPFNVFLVALTSFVSLTTSLFSRPYMRIEREHGRVGTVQLRLYH